MWVYGGKYFRRRKCKYFEVSMRLRRLYRVDGRGGRGEVRDEVGLD